MISQMETWSSSCHEAHEAQHEKKKPEMRNPIVSVLKDTDAIEAIRQTSWTSSEGKYKVESKGRTKRRLTALIPRPRRAIGGMNSTGINMFDTSGT